MNEEFLNRKLQQRKDDQSFRELRHGKGGVDFCSNDYLGIVRNGLLHTGPQEVHGSTGSRLISGNYLSIEKAEKDVAAFHDAEAGLIYNSGYDTNLGLLGSVPQRGDTVLYDYLSHASIRDGIRLSLARSFSFQHNDLDDLSKKLRSATGNTFVVTESVFSMDGDTAPLMEMADLCEKNNAFLIADEAHATGVTGINGEGLVQSLGLQKRCFARVHTFGKAAGCHGAIVLGSDILRNYLINFSRPFIYTTALPANAVEAISAAYALFPQMQKERAHLITLIKKFREKASALELSASESPIQAVIIPGNEEVKRVAAGLQDTGFDVRAILYPTVPRGKERLRVVLHAFNTIEEVDKLVIRINTLLLNPGSIL
jgi:8-amino-7-oxononanoate synthase